MYTEDDGLCTCMCPRSPEASICSFFGTERAVLVFVYMYNGLHLDASNVVRARPTTLFHFLRSCGVNIKQLEYTTNTRTNDAYFAFPRLKRRGGGKEESRKQISYLI